MNSKSFLLAALAGGIAMFLTSFVLYVLVFPAVLSESMQGTIGQVEREEPLMLSIIISQLLLGVFIALVYHKWAGIKTFSTGMNAGVVIGLILGLAQSLDWFGTTTLFDSTMVIADTIAWIVRFGLAGGVVGLVLGKTT